MEPPQISVLYAFVLFSIGLDRAQNTAQSGKHPVATTFHERPPPLSDFSSSPKVSQTNHYIWNLL